MPHFLVLYYIAVTMVGLATLAVSLVGTIRSRVSANLLLIVFYALFTVDVATLFSREYLYVNIADYSYQTVLITYLVSGLVSLAYVATITLYYHRLFAMRLQGLRDGIVLAVALLAASAFVWPNAVTLDEPAGLFVRNLPVQLAAGAYLALFAYLLVVGAAGSKADRPARELVLIWASFAFAIVGFCESLVQFIQALKNPAVVLSPAGRRFMVSTIPYVLFGGVLAYYFGSYLVADARPALRLDDEFARRYQISPREQEVIVLLNQGLGNREIAQKLFVSLATVKSHVHNVYEKTGAKSRYELFRLVLPADRRTA